MKRIRSILLLFRFPPDFAGGSLQASRLMEQLACRGVEMRVLTTTPANGKAARRERAFGGEVIRFPVFGRLFTRDIGLSLRAGWWLLVHSNWDILHISGFSYFGVLPVWIARLKRRPVLIKTTVLGRNGPFNPGGSFFARRLLGTYGRADAIVALSQALEDALRAQPHVGARILQIPNGVDLELFRPARAGEREKARDSFGLPRDATVIVTCGMLYPRKNMIALVRAAALMRSRPVCVVMAGPPGPDAAYLEALRDAGARLPEGARLEILGSLEPERLAALQRAADVYALLSRAEGLPNSLLEGMASGLACVASDIPGAADVLAAGGGVLVPLDDDQALADLLDRLASDPAERRRLGTEARRIIEERYSFARVAGRYLQLYESLLEGDSRGAA